MSYPQPPNGIAPQCRDRTAGSRMADGRQSMTRGSMVIG